MQVTSIVVEGRMCRDMYDEHPGLAYFYVDAIQRVQIPQPLSMEEARALAEAKWRELHPPVSPGVQDVPDEEFDEADGQFTPTRIVLLDGNRTVMQRLDSDGWMTDFASPDQWEALLAQARAMESEASVEAGWDNFSTAEGLRADATRMRRRVSIAQAHFGVLPSVPAAAPRVRAKPNMRGLDERVALAQARITSITDPEKGEDDILSARMDAEARGEREFWQQLYEPPVMFLDEPLLLGSWEHGQSTAARAALEEE
jgi:hypothetical protein